MDVKGLVTIGYGNLVEPFSAVLPLAFTHPDGSPATQSEVGAAWLTVKSQQSAAKLGGGHFARFTTIRATADSINKLCQAKLAEMESELKKFYPDFESSPAKVQLGILSMAWAMGPAFPATWPKFSAAVHAGNWSDAAANCRMSETGQNASFHARNLANLTLFTAASHTDDDLDSLT